MAEIRSVDVRIEGEGEAWRHVRVRALSGREAIGELFWFDVDVVCDVDHELPESAVPASSVAIVFEIDGVEIRRVKGILGPIRDHLDAISEHASYRLRVVPRAFQLTLVETQSIYLGRTIPEILEDKFDLHDLGANQRALRLLGNYPAREIVAQIGESDLAFVSRLAEHWGLSFFFEHADGEERVVFTDHQDGFSPIAGAEEVPYRPRGDRADVFALERVSGLVPSSYIVQDYNYRTPQLDLTGAFDLESGSGGGVVEYGSHVKTPEESERIARLRGEERECRRRVYEGRSSRPELRAGGTFTLVDHPRIHEPLPLLVVAVEHEITIPVFAEAEGGKATYQNRFTAVPAGVPFRPARRTPRPRVPGVVTGIVQPGPGGETGGIAQLDSEGRYTVQFHLDTAPPQTQKASHPMRMAQPFAGAGYGMHMPLRPGTEVLIAFTNGDPDRPVILGALYNTASPSPVVGSSAQRHQIRANTGAIFEFGSKS
jgi:type VI secretion system secreted protein VgrG